MLGCCWWHLLPVKDEQEENLDVHFASLSQRASSAAFGCCALQCPAPPVSVTPHWGVRGWAEAKTGLQDIPLRHYLLSSLVFNFHCCSFKVCPNGLKSTPRSSFRSFRWFIFEEHFLTRFDIRHAKLMCSSPFLSFFFSPSM